MKEISGTFSAEEVFHIISTKIHSLLVKIIFLTQGLRFYRTSEKHKMGVSGCPYLPCKGGGGELNIIGSTFFGEQI